MKTSSLKANQDNYIRLLADGQQAGLNYIYKLYFNLIYSRVYRATKDLCETESIVQNAFLKLWQFRKNISSIESAYEFIKKQVSEAISDYYKLSKTQFRAKTLLLDSLEDYQKYMLGYTIQDEDLDINPDAKDEILESKRKKLAGILPHLCSRKRLILHLCITNSFNFESVAKHLGASSEHKVAKEFEKIIAQLKSLLNAAEKVKSSNSRSDLVLSPTLSNLEQKVLSIRRDLGLTFEEIANRINLSPQQVREIFLMAHMNLKNKSA